MPLVVESNEWNRETNELGNRMNSYVNITPHRGWTSSFDGKPLIHRLDYTIWSSRSQGPFCTLPLLLNITFPSLRDARFHSLYHGTIDLIPQHKHNRQMCSIQYCFSHYTCLIWLAIIENDKKAMGRHKKHLHSAIHSWSGPALLA